MKPCTKARYKIARRKLAVHLHAIGKINADDLEINCAGFSPVRLAELAGIVFDGDAKRAIWEWAGSPKRQPRSQRAPRKPRARKPVTPKVNVNSDAFLESYEWRRLRMTVLKRDGRKCACCGASPETGAVMNVDHIKPRRIFPELALDPNNLQVLCGECNHGKGNWDMTDWRQKVEA